MPNDNDKWMLDDVTVIDLVSGPKWILALDMSNLEYEVTITASYVDGYVAIVDAGKPPASFRLGAVESYLNTSYVAYRLIHDALEVYMANGAES